MRRWLLILGLGMLALQGWAQTGTEFRLTRCVLSEAADLNQYLDFAPKLEWAYSHPAESYLLAISLWWQDSLVWETGIMMTKQTTFTIPGLGLLERGQTYTLTIRAQHPELGWSPTHTLTFTMNTPPTTPQLAPMDQKVLTAYPLVFKYTQASDEQCPQQRLTYQFQLASDSLFTAVRLDTTYRAEPGAVSPELQINKILPDNCFYYARLRASDGVEFSSWSEPIRFGLNYYNESPRAFSLLEPTNDLTLSSHPLLRWERASDPDENFGDGIKEYILELATDSLFRQLILRRNLPSQLTSYRINALDNHQRYYWRVKANDYAGATRLCRRAYSFLTDFGNLPPERPQLLAPIDSAILSPQRFLEWILPLDPEGDPLSCEIMIWEHTNPQQVYQTLIGDSLIQKAASPSRADIVFYPDRRFRIKLQTLGFSDKLKDGVLYRWNVIVHDSWGGASSGDWPNASFIFDDGINQPPLPPQQGFTPNNAIVTTRLPVLQWERARDPDVGDRLRYQVMLSRDPQFAGRTFIMQESSLDKPEVRLGAPLIENARYYWKVRSVDQSGARSEWSPVFSFWVNSVNEPPSGAPRLLAPGHLAVVTPRTYFFWSEVNDPDPGDSVDYLWEFATDPSFHERVMQVRVTPAQARRTIWREHGRVIGTAIGINPGAFPQSIVLRDNALYYWRVIPVDRWFAKGSPSSERYRIAFNSQNDPPYPVTAGFAPRGGAVITTLQPEISWEASSDPDFNDFKTQLIYQVELAPEATFPPGKTRQLQTEPGVTSVKITSDLTENTRWFYRIRVQDKQGAYSEWSAVQNFITNAHKEAPLPVTAGFLPRDSMIVDTQKPTLTWLPTDDPDPDQTSEQLYYLVRYYTAKDGKLVGQVASQRGVASVQLPTLKEDYYYYYQVAAVDPDGKQSTWSPPNFFGVNAVNSPPDPFPLLSPTYQRDSVAVDVHFCWKWAIDRDPGSKLHYTLYYSPDSTFTNWVNEVVVTPPELDSVICYQPTQPLEEGRRYYWKVVATDDQGATRWASGTDKKPFVFKTISRRSYSADAGGLNTLKLLQNYPNPFNVVTRIQYEVPEYLDLEVAIYDLLGQRVRLLANGTHARGVYTVYWDGTDDAGTSLPGGVYICRLTTRTSYINRKVILLR